MERAVEKARLTAEEMLAMMTQFYEGLSEEEIDEIERIILDRRDFFGRPLRQDYTFDSEVK